MFTKKIMAAATVAIASLGMAASAQATITPGAGSGIEADSVTPIALGSIIECDSHLGGSVVTSRAAGLGGTGVINSASFSSCNIGSAAPIGTPNWTLDVNGSGVATVSGIAVRINLGSGTTCDYAGSLTGTYSNATGDAVLSGSLTRTARSGFLSGLCGATEVVSGTYNLYVSATGLPPQVS